jgi:hypothetical protein
MRRTLVVLAALLALALIGSGAPAQAGPVIPYGARPYGHSYQTWLRTVGQFYLGDASNPLFAGLDGDCGELMDGMFVMAAPIDVGVEFECDVPVGTPIVLSHAGFFATQGIDGETDEELHAIAEAGFTFASNSLTLDGGELPLTTIDAGVFDVQSQPGSFYDTLFGLTGAVRTALVGNVVVLHPLRPGDHVIEAEVTFVGAGGGFSATYHVHVG